MNKDYVYWFFVLLMSVFAVATILTINSYIQPNRVHYIPITGSLIVDEVMVFPPGHKTHISCNSPAWNQFNVTLNNEGFRDHNITKQHLMIGVFGDSYVWGICVDNNNTIDVAMEREFSEKGIAHAVYNFGQAGYNLNSSLIQLQRMHEAYELDYAIVYYQTFADLVPCDITCQRRWYRDHDVTPGETSEYFDDYTDYWTAYFRSNPNEAFRQFKQLVDERLVDTGITKSSKIYFYFPHTTSAYAARNFEPFISYLGSVGITVIYDHVDCKRDNCKVPDDGHPTAYYNKQAAKLIVNATLLSLSE